MHKIDGNILGSFRTNIKKNDSNPQFNQMSVFKVTTNELSQIFFKITVYEISNCMEIEIGHFFIGPNKKTEGGKSHWEQMIRLVRRQVFEFF